MVLPKEKIDALWKKAKNGKYYDNKDLKGNNGSTKGLKSYDFEEKRNK